MGASDSSRSNAVNALGGTAFFLICAVGAIALFGWLFDVTSAVAVRFVQSMAQSQFSDEAQAGLTLLMFFAAPIALAVVYTYLVEPRLTSMRVRQVARFIVAVVAAVLLSQLRDIESLLPAASAVVVRMLIDWSLKVGAGVLIAWGIYRLVRWLVRDERAARGRVVTDDPPL